MGHRSEFFPDLKCSSPGWAIVLDLLVQQDRGRPVSVHSACLATDAPMTTALRHLTKLIEAGYVTRVADAEDGRRHFVRLSASMEGRLREYLSRVGPP
jgi:DNA-binding IclR family transcriptional regulator